MKRKEDILDVQHWKIADYRQRIKAEDWRKLLMNDDDKIIFQGRVIPLAAKNLGCGVYEISKQLTSASTGPGKAPASDA